MRLQSLILTIILITPTLYTSGQGGQKQPIESDTKSEGVFTMPEVGKPMPDFTLNNITHFKTTKASLKDFKGKWVFLDFWFPGCVNCIKSFPMVNEIQKKFKDDIVYMLIGLNYNKYNYIEKLYEELRVKQNLELPSAFDSLLARRWSIYSMPDIYIVDPNGKLAYRTNGIDMTIEKVRDLIAGGNPFFSLKDKKDLTVGINNKTPSTFDSLVLFQSILTEYANNKVMMNPINYQMELDIYKRKGYKAQGATLSALYTIAYIGKIAFIKGAPDSLYEKVYPMPIIQDKDSTIILDDKKISEKLRKRYNYSLDLPRENLSKEELMKQMQEDLKRYFGYSASIEKRKMPVWVLRAKPGTGERLKTSTTSYFDIDPDTRGMATGFSVKNTSIKDLLYGSVQYLQEVDGQPFFDETGIKNNVDITIKALMTDIDQVRRELKRNGFDLIQSEREMNVVVLKRN